MKNHNVIRIEGSINDSQLVRFIKAYEKANKKDDLHIHIQTSGGFLHSTDAICNIILSHTTSKIYCYINHYAHSGGSKIALTCDKIFMSKYATMSPCDVQINSVPTDAIIKSISSKIKNGQNVKEEWLITYHKAKLFIEKDKEFINRLIDTNKYSKSVIDQIYINFFSGKYDHYKIFTYDDLLKLKLNVDIIENVTTIQYYEREKTNNVYSKL